MRIQAQQQVRWAPWEQGPPPLTPFHSAVSSCCVLGISCHCSCDHLLPAAQRGPLPARTDPSPPSSPQSQCSGSGLELMFSARLFHSQEAPYTGPERAFSPAAPAGGGASGLLSPSAPTPGSLLRPGLPRGVEGNSYALLSSATPLLPSASFSLVSVPPALWDPCSHSSLPLSSWAMSQLKEKPTCICFLVLCLCFSAFSLTFDGKGEKRILWPPGGEGAAGVLHPLSELVSRLGEGV